MNLKKKSNQITISSNPYPISASLGGWRSQPTGSLKQLSSLNWIMDKNSYSLRTSRNDGLRIAKVWSIYIFEYWGHVIMLR